MNANFDWKPLTAFFQEVKDQLDIQLKFLPDNADYPIQLDETPDGLPRSKWFDLIQFIKLQTDLRENEIGKIHPIKNSKNVIPEISAIAAKTLAEVYGLSMFYNVEDNEDA